MSQTIAIIAGLGAPDARQGRAFVLGGRVLTPVSVGDAPPADDSHSAAWGVRALQKARDNLVKAWGDAWALRAIAYNQAAAAILKRDKDLYTHAQQQWVEAGRIQKKMAADMATNDALRISLLKQVEGKMDLTAEARAWFDQPYGLQPPDAYNAGKGGHAIPKFPVYS